MKNVRVHTMIASCAFVVAMAGPADSACTYGVADGGVKVEWTAFKFTQKQGVTGSFNTTQLAGPETAPTLTALASGLSMTIDGASIESGNPARNSTISEFFFRKFVPSATITGKVEGVEGDDSKGIVRIAIGMNGKSQTVPFTYEISADHAVTATATIDLMGFALEKPFDSLHEACAEQHTGEDGISKTWTEVVLKLTGAFTETCD